MLSLPSATAQLDVWDADRWGSVQNEEVYLLAAMQHVFAIARQVNLLLDGATEMDPSQHGLTTEEERATCSHPQVPLQPQPRPYFEEFGTWHAYP